MSISWMNRVMESPEPTGTARMVMLVLADRSDELGVCHPGVDYIAKRAAVSRRQVQRHLAMLEEKGWLKRATNQGPSYRGDKRPSLYQLLEKRGDVDVTPSAHGVTSKVERGDIQGSHGVTSKVERGGIGVTQSVIDPLRDTSERQGTGKRSVFTPPSLEDWIDHCSTIGYCDANDAEAAWAHYTSNGWKQNSGLPIKDWRAAAITARQNWKRWRSNGKNSSGEGAAVVVADFDTTKAFAHTGGVEEAR